MVYSVRPKLSSLSAAQIVLLDLVSGAAVKT